ncbi:hypothetical protein C5S36_11215 [Candidatus Methanophagaceae archaeon]|nr:hypothetical protein C5S36_11215 [Methanophagales archaeon]
MSGTGATAEDQDRNTSWMREIKGSLKTAGILIEIGTDASLRNALIVIDNSNEVFMKYFLRYEKGLRYVKEEKKKQDVNNLKFHELIEEMRKHDFSNTALLDKIQLFHDSRNALYHDPKKLTVSRETLETFIKESLEMYNIALEAKIELKELYAGYDELKEDIRKRDWNKRYDELGRLMDDIKSSFGFTPDDYGWPFIASTPDPISGLDVFQTLFFGALARDQSGGKAVRVLEFVDCNEENSWHDFYISRIGSHTWHGIVRCFWSKWGEGNRRGVKQIHELLKKYKSRVEYQEEARSIRYYHREALDQFFLK